MTSIIDKYLFSLNECRYCDICTSLPLVKFGETNSYGAIGYVSKVLRTDHL